MEGGSEGVRKRRLHQGKGKSRKNASSKSSVDTHCQNQGKKKPKKGRKVLREVLQETAVDPRNDRERKKKHR